MNVSAPGTALYAKAKQRVLNKMGKKTSLTRNERVDFVSPRLEEIARCRKDVTALARNFRAQYRKTLWAGTQLSIHLISMWSSEIGHRSYAPEIDAYIREKDAEQLMVVQEASDDIRTVMEKLEKLSADFDYFLKKKATGPFAENDGSEVEKLENVIQSKEAYRIARTKYSDAMINFKIGACSAQELDAVSMDYENCTKALETAMAEYENHWRHHLFQGISTFFKEQQWYIEQVGETLADLDLWTSHMSLDVNEMKAHADKLREGRHVENALRETAGDEVGKMRAGPMFASTLLGYPAVMAEAMTPLNSGSSQDEEWERDGSEGYGKSVDLQRDFGEDVVGQAQGLEGLRGASAGGRQQTA